MPQEWDLGVQGVKNLSVGICNSCAPSTALSTVPSEIQWTSFFFLKMSLMISFCTKILHMHIIYHRLIYNCMFEHLRLENKSGISCKIKQLSRF